MHRSSSRGRRWPNASTLPQSGPRDNAYIDSVATSEVAVIGGGIVGLVAAKAAIDNDLLVTLYDPTPGCGASFAAAGMISPGSEFLGGFAHEYESSVVAARQWPGFAAELNVPLYVAATDVVGWSSGDRNEVVRYLDIARTNGVEVCAARRVDANFDLSPRIGDFWRFPHEMFVDVDALLEKLISYVRERGRLVTESVHRITPSEGHVEVEAATNLTKFDKCIVATGAHSLPGLPLPIPKVRASRGVTMRLRGPRGAPGMVRGFVDGRQIYAVRHPSGEIVVGAISDELSTTHVAVRDIRELSESISRLIPAIEEAEFVEARAGLRPTTDNARSFFVAAHQRLAVTSGYFRHGVLLAPVARSRAEDFWRA